YAKLPAILAYDPDVAPLYRSSDRSQLGIVDELSLEGEGAAFSLSIGNHEHPRPSPRQRGFQLRCHRGSADILDASRTKSMLAERFRLQHTLSHGRNHHEVCATVPVRGSDERLR